MAVDLDKCKELIKQGFTLEDIKRRVPDEEFTPEIEEWINHPYQSKDNPILPNGFPIAKPKRHTPGEWTKGKIVSCLGKRNDKFYPEFQYTVQYDDGQITVRWEEECIKQAKKYKEVFGANK